MRSPSSLLYAALLATMLTGLGGCKVDPPVPPVEEPSTPTGTLRVTMIPEWEGEPLQFYHEYRNVSDYRTTVELLKFYWGDVRLIDGMESTPVTMVGFFDLLNGPVTKEWKTATGTWTGLRTGLGVPEVLNHTDPTLYGQEHPLSLNNLTHWDWANGYRFVMFEGRYDPDPASTAPFVNTYSFHTGLDTCYREMDLLPVLPITVTKDSVTNVIVHVAVDGFFHSSFGTIDLATESSSNGTNLPIALKFTHNVLQSFSIE